MKDFAKSIVCNVKAEVAKVGNFEDPKKAKYYIEMWERRRDDAKRSLQNAEGHLKEAMKHRYGDKEFNQREVQRYQEAIKAAEASIKQYDDLIKAAAKSSFGNSKVGNKSNYRYKGFLITFSQDGIHVFLQNGYTVAYGPTGSEEKAKDWCDWHDPKTNKPVAEFRNSKVGNAIQGNPEEQAKKYAYAYEAAKKNGDTEEMNKQKGYIKILRSQIKEELKEVEARRALLNGANILLMGY